MARAMHDLPQVQTVQEILLFALGDGVLGRWWNAFALRPELVAETDMRVNDRLFVPHDSPEVPLTDLDTLRQLYPAAPDWFEERFFPSTVPVPTPSVVYFFHNFMLEGTDEARAYLRNVFQLYYALMFAAFWWHEAARGGVGIVLPHETINYLVRTLGDIPIDPDRPFGPRSQTKFP